MISPQSILSVLLQWLPSLLVGIAVLLAFWLLAQLTKLLILRVAKRSAPSKAYVFNWLGQFAKNVLIVVGLITAAASMGVNVSALVASLGLTGVAVGFAMKESLANTLAGTLVLIYPPFHLGDFIKVCGFEGKVYAINMRYTSLINQEEKILIPNITFLTHPIVVVEAKEIT